MTSVNSHTRRVSSRGKAKGLRSNARPVEVIGVERTDRDIRVGTGDDVSREDVSGEALGEPAEADVEDATIDAPATFARVLHILSQREIDDHDLVHCPYTAWCEHCVWGQARVDCH